MYLAVLLSVHIVGLQTCTIARTTLKRRLYGTEIVTARAEQKSARLIPYFTVRIRNLAYWHRRRHAPRVM